MYFSNPFTEEGSGAEVENTLKTIIISKFAQIYLI